MPSRAAGLMLVSTDATGTERLSREARQIAPHLDPMYLAPGEAQRREPVLAADVAECRLDIGYPVEPGAATRAYAALAESKGAHLRIGSAATLLVGGGRVTGVHTEAGDIVAGAVIVAAGPW